MYSEFRWTQTKKIETKMKLPALSPPRNVASSELKMAIGPLWLFCSAANAAGPQPVCLSAPIWTSLYSKYHSIVFQFWEALVALFLNFPIYKNYFYFISQTFPLSCHRPEKVGSRSGKKTKRNALQKAVWQFCILQENKSMPFKGPGFHLAPRTVFVPQQVRCTLDRTVLSP